MTVSPFDDFHAFLTNLSSADKFFMILAKKRQKN